MTLHWYRGLAKQFIKETEFAASEGLIDPTRANWVKAAIEIALDPERAASSGQVPPDFGRADGTGRGSLSAQRTRKL